MRRIRLPLLLICSLVFLSGCKRLSSGAQETFARDFSCPEDRVKVSERKDLSFGDLWKPTTGEPPEEVEADPGRLSKWKADRRAERAGLDNFEVYEAKGCGHEQLFGCRHPADPAGSTLVSEVVCIRPPELR